MKLIAGLINNGFYPFRFIKSEYLRCDNPYYFSSIEEGMIDLRLVKGEKEIVVGLLEVGFSPTLISPRLGVNHDEINRRIERTSLEEIIALAK